MKKKMIAWFIKIAWPVIKFVIVNFGTEITSYVFNLLKVNAKKRSIFKAEEAMRKAEDAEREAENAEDPELKVQYFEIAKAYKEEAEYHKKFINDFIEEIEKSSADILKNVQKEVSKVEAEDLFIFDKKQGTLKPVEDKKLLENKTND